MTATIYSHKTIIGTTELRIGDEDMGCVYGQFIPNENYYNYIQKCVWDFLSTNKPDYAKWNSLRFNAQLDNGFFLFPFGGYTFDDSPELPNEQIRIDISGIDLKILSLTKNSLLEPWSAIDIGQKIFFEDELSKEVTPVKSLVNFLSLYKKETHALAGVKVSALAKYGPNDNVLFAINKNKVDCKLATVHLTWKSRETEHSSYFPATHFYLDFNDFKERRMMPDNLNWE